MAELLAPAGDFATALSAFAAGADAVYCGLADFSARAFATNLSLEELKDLVAYARSTSAPGRPPRRVYVTFNTLLDETQLESAAETLSRLEQIGPDALIVQDLGVARLCRRHFPKLAIHASTQLVAHNLEGVLALAELGFSRVVLARELSLAEITAIAKRCGKVELECFIHGALCYSLSGLCLFGAMEKHRSGNRGQCPYLCRQCVGGKYPFSMKDLRLGEDARELAEAGVASLKIEGRMKSPLYVASVTRYYRQILDGVKGGAITVPDLETVFSRRTTELYFKGAAESPIDSESLGHVGTEIGTVKKVTRDRDGSPWLRFHTTRALEKHDGLQFSAMTKEGRHLGMGIVEMRKALSRHSVFEVEAGADVEVLVTEETAEALRPGMRVYCSMSNAVKRIFPAPGFRRSEYPGNVGVSVRLEVLRDRVTALATDWKDSAVAIGGKFDLAQHPEKSEEAARRAFSKLGGTDYRLEALMLEDPEKLFVPASILNDLRRDLVERLDSLRDAERRAKLDAIAADAEPTAANRGNPPRRVLKLRPGQSAPGGDWDEIVLAVNADVDLEELPRPESGIPVRLSLPVFTSELQFGRLRIAAKRMLHAGYAKWEASDLATLRMLKELGVEDVTADWSLYAFNSQALATVFGLGVRRMVASPENSRENLQYLAESGYPVEFLVQQSTPLFVSLTEPAASTGELVVFRRDGLWVTTRACPRTFEIPGGSPQRVDLSWDSE